MKAIVRPQVKWDTIPSYRPSTMLAARETGSSSSPAFPLGACTQARQSRNTSLVSSALHPRADSSSFGEGKYARGVRG